ncbi:hypothetical protein CNEO_43246 [Clostridium neonatale]|uniref:Uncharacterized protein n=1 Tax=Clostridium neonatale TaxID=137838 RepID=A0AA86JL78_9CLOT|nr:hypothetical protein CNEO_43246 [Clostridium neonatale]
MVVAITFVKIFFISRLKILIAFFISSIPLQILSKNNYQSKHSIE